MYRSQNGYAFNQNTYSGSFGAQGAIYQGRAQEPYKPVGFVQSQYTGSVPYQTTQSFHTANYRGNVPGHDQSLRSDSNTPTYRSNVGVSHLGVSNVGVSNIGAGIGGGVPFQAGSSFQGSTAFQSGAAIQSGTLNQGATTYPVQQSYPSAASFQTNTAIPAQQAYGQPLPTTQSFHTANYRGNIPGHDQSLRSDSNTPTASVYNTRF